MTTVSGLSRADVAKWYFDWIEDRLGKPIERHEDWTFVDDYTLDSQDLTALRADIKAEFGQVVPDEEAEKNDTVGKAVNATCGLLGISS